MSLQVVPDPEHTALVYARVSTKEQAQGGGDGDGYSLPAQRDACRRKAQSMNATVLHEFVDAGESARTADRRQLQQMLLFLARERVDYVIVHKIDRLARNRADDVALTAAITASGAKLVSVTENIDETPSGLLLHGIMSSIAEFYSKNLANEVIKGTQQKVRAGGTPTRAPIGYRNVRQLVDGYEVRTVEVDTERAPHITWAFEQYATGLWSLSTLADALADRGLTTRPGPKSPVGPVAHNKLQGILRNRYYLGIVRWRGVEYDGKHPPIVDVHTFERVQQMLTDHRQSSERPSKRGHYLVGTLRCGICHERLLYTVSRGRNGKEYGYFYCNSRWKGGKTCGLRHLPEHAVEELVERQWMRESIAGEALAELQKDLHEQLAVRSQELAEVSRVLEERVHAIRRERFRWAEKAMAGVVPDDIAAEKQAGLARSLADAELALSQQKAFETVDRANLSGLFNLAQDAGNVYQQAPPAMRRSMNRSWFTDLVITEDEDGLRVTDAEREPLTAALRSAAARRSVAPASGIKKRRQQDASGVSTVDVSNFALLVELRGLEPLTLCMPCRCATSCATAPISVP